MSTVRKLTVVMINAYTTLIFAGCFGGNYLGIPLFKLTVVVLDASRKPITGAIVEASNGERLTTDSTGTVNLRFSDVGAYYISVYFQNSLIASYNVSMPGDGGKIFTATYNPEVAAAPQAPPAAGGNVNMFAAMGERFYPILFQYLFNAYGYSIDMGNYQPGQWTRWEMSTEDKHDAFVTQKAFLKKLDNGNTWWQVSFGEDKDSILLEIMFSPKQESIRRMRQRFGNQQPQEVPVTEGWYNAPMNLTPESIEGSVTKKDVSVTVGAGTFKADLLEFGVAPGLSLRIWRVATIPGGVVKYELTGGGSNIIYSAELASYGDNATTVLGSF